MQHARAAMIKLKQLQTEAVADDGSDIS